MEEEQKDTREVSKCIAWNDGAKKLHQDKMSKKRIRDRDKIRTCAAEANALRRFECIPLTTQALCHLLHLMMKKVVANENYILVGYLPHFSVKSHTSTPPQQGSSAPVGIQSTKVTRRQASINLTVTLKYGISGFIS